MTCGLEDKIRKRGQDKKSLMKELVEGKENYDQIVSVACLNCDGMAWECIEAQDMITELHPEKCGEIINENIWMLDSADTDMDGASIGQITT